MLRGWVSRNWAGSIISFLNLLSLSFCIADGVHEAYPVVSSFAKVTGVHTTKGWLNNFQAQGHRRGSKPHSMNIQWQSKLLDGCS